MAFIELSYDESKKLFAIPVILSRNKRTSSLKTETLHKQKLMYVDTGSSRTSIVDSDAVELEINVGNLPKEDVSGIGGITQLPVSNEITITLLDSQRLPVSIQLEKVTIFSSLVKRKIERNKGVYKERGYTQGKMVNIFGLDSLELLKSELIINMKEKKGRVELIE